MRIPKKLVGVLLMINAALRDAVVEKKQQQQQPIKIVVTSAVRKKTASCGLLTVSVVIYSGCPLPCAVARKNANPTWNGAAIWSAGALRILSMNTS